MKRRKIKCRESAGCKRPFTTSSPSLLQLNKGPHRMEGFFRPSVPSCLEAGLSPAGEAGEEQHGSLVHGAWSAAGRPIDRGWQEIPSKGTRRERDQEREGRVSEEDDQHDPSGENREGSESKSRGVQPPWAGRRGRPRGSRAPELVPHSANLLVA